MITRLTDLTLRCLDLSSASDEALREFYTLLYAAGADLVEVSPATACRLGGALVPARTVLHISRLDEAVPGFARYCCGLTEETASFPLLREVRVNDIREISVISRYRDLPGLRMVGLDDLFLHDFRRVLNRLRREFAPSTELCPTNACGCASALLTEWLLEDGGNGAAAFAGAGGYAPLEETILALRLNRKYQKRSDLSVLPRLTELYGQITGKPVSPHKAVVGRDIFAVESGIHVDGILKNAAVYEPYPPELVGARRRIAIGKHSGHASLLFALKQAGYSPDPDSLDDLLGAVRRESGRLHRELSEEELLFLAREEGVL